MPISRSRKRKPRIESHQKPHQEKEKRPLIRRVLASWLARGILCLSAVAAIFGVADFYNRLYPEIYPLADSSKPGTFYVGNPNPLFDMKNVRLGCDIENTSLAMDNGQGGFSIPIISGVVNPSIPAGESVTYDCTASDFMKKFDDGRLCMGNCPGASALPLLNEIVRVGMTYRIFGWPEDFHYETEQYTWDGHYWRKGPAFH